VNKKKTEIVISKGLLTFLKVCFYFNLLGLVLLLTFPLFLIFELQLYVGFDKIVYAKTLNFIGLPTAILWWYSIFFYFKHDKYSSAGLKLFLLNMFFTPIYFYKVIWKRRRKLKDSYEPEPVIGNTINLESYE
jgi:hypothetical protein